MIAAVIHTSQREQPDWDPTAELQRLRAVDRWRRRPVFLWFLGRVAHLGQVRRG